MTDRVDPEVLAYRQMRAKSVSVRHFGFEGVGGFERPIDPLGKGPRRSFRL